MSHPFTTRQLQIQSEICSLMLLIQAEEEREYKRDKLGRFAEDPEAKAQKQEQDKKNREVVTEFVAKSTADKAQELGKVANSMSSEERTGVAEYLKTKEHKGVLGAVEKMLGKVSKAAEEAFKQTWTVISDTLEDLAKDTGTKALNLGEAVSSRAVGVAKSATRHDTVVLGAYAALNLAGMAIGIGVMGAAMMAYATTPLLSPLFMTWIAAGTAGRYVFADATTDFIAASKELQKEFAKTTPKDAPINAELRNTQRELEKKERELSRTENSTKPKDEERTLKLLGEIDATKNKIEKLRQNKEIVKKYEESGRKIREGLQDKTEINAARAHIEAEIDSKLQRSVMMGGIQDISEMERLKVVAEIQEKYYKDFVESRVKERAAKKEKEDQTKQRLEKSKEDERKNKQEITKQMREALSNPNLTKEQKEEIRRSAAERLKSTERFDDSRTGDFSPSNAG